VRGRHGGDTVRETVRETRTVAQGGRHREGDGEGDTVRDTVRETRWRLHLRVGERESETRGRHSERHGEGDTVGDTVRETVRETQ
jgi:hypothetical protein